MEFLSDTVLTYVSIIKEDLAAWKQSWGLSHMPRYQSHKRGLHVEGTKSFHIMNFGFYDFLISIHWGLKIYFAQTDKSWLIQ